MSSAENGRVTVSLVIAPDAMIAAYPVGLKVKVSCCEVLTFDTMNDPAFMEALGHARKSHPIYKARMSFLAQSMNGISASDLEQKMDEDILKDLFSANSTAKSSAPQLSWGQRVVTIGLSTDWLNGATCSVASALDLASGRYTLRVLAPPESVKKCNGMVRVKHENLKCQTWSRPHVDPATQWIDEFGWICNKNVNYSQHCPRSHDMVAACDLAVSGECSVCDESDAHGIWTCCGGCGFKVCFSCRTSLSQQHEKNPLVPASVANAGSVLGTSPDDFPMLVGCVRCFFILSFFLEMNRSSLLEIEC
jgi:hypothetical protein